MKRAVLATFLWAVSAFSAVAQADRAAAVAAAMEQIRDGDFARASSTVRPHGQVAHDIVLWHQLRSGRAAFGFYQDFLARRPDWPGLPLLRQMGEAAITDDTPADEVIAYFAAQLPRTGTGSLKLANALERINAGPVAADEIRRAWLTLRLDEDELQQFLQRHQSIIRDLHMTRLDTLIWEGRFSEAADMLPLVSADQRQLAETRLALLRGESGVDDMIDALPSGVLDDPGLAHARFVWRMRAGLVNEAEELLVAQSARPGGLQRPEHWSDRRLTLAHRAMREGRNGRAYLISANHGLQSGADFAALEWLAGYVALTRLDDPIAALGHFRRFRTSVDTPISLGRAGYWEGRALEALGRLGEAQTAYAFGAEFQTAFYGQLAAIKAGIPMDPALVGSEVYPPLRGSALEGSTVLEAARLFHDAGDKALFRRFLRHLAESGTGSEMGLIGDLALEYDEPYTAIYIAKFAADSGHLTVRPYFPIPDGFAGDLPVDRALALAVARRESEFNDEAVSHAGARGLMQLMPGTADLMAGVLGITHDTRDLTRDSALNVRLGTAYLARLSGEMDGYLPAMAAGYNAGPNRAFEWQEKFGNPRGSAERAVDWIETIPFYETRNYVMRVLEGYEVYRARLAGKPVDWSLDRVLAGK